MPCSKYKSKKQRGLCYLTEGWKSFDKAYKLQKKSPKKYSIK